jgi:hypothetical protein
MSSIAIQQIGLSEPPSNKVKGWLRWFILSAGWILLVTGLAKIVSVFGHAKILDIDDPILGISFRNLMLLAGGIELAISGLFLLTSKYRLNLTAVTWIATVFLSYRFGLSCIQWHRPCPCLGNLTDLIHIPPGLENLLMTLVAVYLFTGSVFLGLVLIKTPVESKNL